MQIVREKGSLIATHLIKDSTSITLNEDGLFVRGKDGFKSPKIKSTSHEIVYGPAPEVKFFGGLLIYDLDSGWNVINQQEYDDRHDAWSSSVSTELQRVKELRQSEVSKLRDLKEADGFTYLNKPFDSDERSTLRILIAAQAAQAAINAGQSFSLTWGLKDNTTITMNETELQGIPLAMAQQKNALHQRARQLKQEIEDAVDVDALEAIDITTGWKA